MSTTTYNGLTYEQLVTHECKQYHYGDQSVLRQCCVDVAIGWNAMAREYAFTNSHPAMVKLDSWLTCLTETELAAFNAVTQKFNPYR